MTERALSPNPDQFPNLRAADIETLPTDSLIARIYPAGGEYATLWANFRHYGPTHRGRFDHHLPPPREQERAILYAVSNRTPVDNYQPDQLKIAIAEAFQATNTINSNNDPHFALFTTTKELKLLRLSDSDWVTRSGGNAAITSGNRDVAQQWARAIYDHYNTNETNLDGIIYASSVVPPARCMALWQSAQVAIPTRPDLNIPLTASSLRVRIEKTAGELAYNLVFP